MASTYPSSEIKAQPGRSTTESARREVVVQAGPHSRIRVQDPPLHRHVYREETHTTRAVRDAAILADAVPRLSLDTRHDMHLRRPCLDCNRLTRPGRSRCDLCNRVVRKRWSRQSVLNRQRRMRGAGGGAQRLRRTVNTQGGSSCMGCGSWHQATDIVIDHVVPMSRHGTDLDDNVQPLCIACHRIKTRREQSATVNA
jgi:5-methylcytosine-specific restriction protein A